MKRCFSADFVAKWEAHAPAGFMRDFRKVAILNEHRVFCVGAEEMEWLTWKYKGGKRYLGDRVYAVLHPIARWLDRRLGTKWATCSACSDRRIWINRLDMRMRTFWHESCAYWRSKTIEPKDTK